jgi:hypothetical protein
MLKTKLAVKSHYLHFLGFHPEECQYYLAELLIFVTITTIAVETSYFFRKITLASESMLAGSAGMLSSTVLVSTAMTPTGMPPSLARPQTTVCAHGCRISWNESLSKKPLSHSLAFAAKN